MTPGRWLALAFMAVGEFVLFSALGAIDPRLSWAACGVMLIFVGIFCWYQTGTDPTTKGADNDGDEDDPGRGHHH